MMLAKWGAVLVPLILPTPGAATPRLHGTACPRIDTGLAGALHADVGTKFISKFPQIPKARGTAVWPVSGVSAGAVLARRNAAVTQRPGVNSVISPQTAAAGPWLCPSPGQGRGGRPSSSGTTTQPWASLFSLFFPYPVENNI